VARHAGKPSGLTASCVGRHAEDASDVRFAQSGDVLVAYAVSGAGPADIVYVEGAYTHLEVDWGAATVPSILRAHR
jgi:hypothetical protein